ncbi:MAG: hypothetical protein JSW10_10825 [Pseudomonadota bacterium]|nr:MAG: hypothetical protein JSW10_10825 [Pseudomonadota bacterium]
MTHRLCTTDPISLHDIDDPTGKPYVVEGDRYNDITIYFESEENRQAYLAIPVEHPEEDLGMSLDNPTDIMIDEG